MKLWEESATDEAVGMQRDYGQIGAWSPATRGGGRVARRLCSWSTGRKDRASGGDTNLNSKWRKTLPTLPARAKRGNVME